MPLRIKVILNPSSGRETARTNVEDTLGYLAGQSELSRADIFYTAKRFDATEFAQDTDPDEYDLLLAAGGDGTVNEVITGLMRGQVEIPLAIYTSGTVNDFATTMKLPSDPTDFARMLLNHDIKPVDCGRCEDTYFLNVLAGGLLSDVAYTAPVELKTAFGPAAYWMSAIKDFQTSKRTMPLTLKSDKVNCSTDCVLFLVSNSPSVGGFRNLMTLADIDDGLLDVLVLKKPDVLGDAFSLIGKMVMNDHINSDTVIYFQTNKLELSTDSEDKTVLDIDGEEGPAMPVTVECIKGGINLIVPKED